MNEDRSQENKSELQELRERHRRYEALRREQLGATLNLTFGLAAAGVGFCASLVVNKDSEFHCPGTCIFLAATFTFMLAVAFGMIANFTRLKDFRLTAEMLKLKKDYLERENPDDQRKIDNLDDMTRRLGVWTWRWFHAQQITFATAVILLSIALWQLYQDHLFPPTT